LRTGLCAERLALSGGAKRDGLTVGGGEVSKPRQRRDHEPGALLDLLGLREVPRDLFDGQRLLRRFEHTHHLDRLRKEPWAALEPTRNAWLNSPKRPKSGDAA
jgi:hypothetical protein